MLWEHSHTRPLPPPPPPPQKKKAKLNSGVEVKINCTSTIGTQPSGGGLWMKAEGFTVLSNTYQQKGTVCDWMRGFSLSLCLLTRFITCPIFPTLSLQFDETGKPYTDHSQQKCHPFALDISEDVNSKNPSNVVRACFVIIVLDFLHTHIPFQNKIQEIVWLYGILIEDWSFDMAVHSLCISTDKRSQSYCWWSPLFSHEWAQIKACSETSE